MISTKSPRLRLDKRTTDKKPHNERRVLTEAAYQEAETAACQGHSFKSASRVLNFSEAVFPRFVKEHWPHLAASFMENGKKRQTTQNRKGRIDNGNS